MNLGQPVKRPVGRGAFLRNLVANASSSSNSDESRSNISASTSSESLLDTSKISSPEPDASSSKQLDISKDSGDTGYRSNASQGRGRVLQRLLHATDSISNDKFNLEAAPKPYGMGRGRIFKILGEHNQPSEEKVDDGSVESIDDGIESLSVDCEPVIRKGTHG